MARFKDISWDLPADARGNIAHWRAMEIAALMDIRDELKKLNVLLHCDNFQNIPRKLDSIRRNTTKPRKQKP